MRPYGQVPSPNAARVAVRGLAGGEPREFLVDAARRIIATIVPVGSRVVCGGDWHQEVEFRRETMRENGYFCCLGMVHTDVTKHVVIASSPVFLIIADALCWSPLGLEGLGVMGKRRFGVFSYVFCGVPVSQH